MLTKLTFYYETFSKINQGEIITNSIVVIDSNTKEDIGIDLSVIYEYSKIFVKFESDDDNAVLEIDNSISEYPLELTPSDELVLISNAGEYEEMLTPGYYGVNIFAYSKKYSGMFFIRTTSVDWNGLVNLRRYLETIMTGLSQNLYIQRMVGQKNIYGDENYSLNKMYSYINNNIVIVLNSINNIVKNPLNDIKKQYKEQNNSKKQDVKSQRWLCTKGFHKNVNIYCPDIVFEKHSILNNDIPENCYTKQIIQNILDIILFVESSYVEINDNLTKIIVEKNELYEKNKALYEISYRDPVVSGEYKYEKRSSLKHLQSELDKLRERCSFLMDILLNIKKIKAVLLQCLNETWLTDISYINKKLNVSKKLLKDIRYFQIYDFYMNISDIEKNDTKIRKPYFPNKSTAKLFEYYTVSLVIDIIRGMEYEWISGWLADNRDEEFLNGEIETNNPMIFIKDGTRVELVYEKEVANSLTVIENNVSDFVRMTGAHYKPDIMLSLYNDETGKLIKSVVIEVKCRMSKNLQSKNGPSDTIEHARSYDNFGYYDKNKTTKNKIQKDVIAEVIIIYPKQDKVVSYKWDDLNLVFIQVEAEDTLDVSKHYGYEELKEEIYNFFSQYVS